MKNAVARGWKSLGSTGRLLVSITLFYFICKTMK